MATQPVIDEPEDQLTVLIRELGGKLAEDKVEPLLPPACVSSAPWVFEGCFPSVAPPAEALAPTLVSQSPPLVGQTSQD